MEPAAVFVFVIFIALVAIAIIVPQVERRGKQKKSGKS